MFKAPGDDTALKLACLVRAILDAYDPLTASEEVRSRVSCLCRFAENAQKARTNGKLVRAWAWELLATRVGNVYAEEFRISVPSH